jgi:hypothetical protein
MNAEIIRFIAHRNRTDTTACEYVWPADGES